MTQVSTANEFDLATGLKALLRQDPEVLMVSEIRDPVAAALALGASLTGHLVIGSFHAASAAGAMSRLCDMGVELYVLRSGVLAILCQRLVRRLCDCAEAISTSNEALGLPLSTAKRPVGCDECLGTGYRGRTLIAELLLPRQPDLGAAILSGVDAENLQELAVAGGMTPLWQRALQLVEAGATSPEEVRRVLGFDDPWRAGATT